MILYLHYAKILVSLYFASFAVWRPVWSWFIYSCASTGVAASRCARIKRLLMSIVIVLRTFPFMYCARGCLFFIFLVFLFCFLFSTVFGFFLLSFFLLLLTYQTAPMLLCPLRASSRSTVRRTFICSIYPDVANTWELFALVQCVLWMISCRYMIADLINIAILWTRPG